MKTVKMFLAVLVVLSSVSFSQVKWNADASHSSVVFRVKHLVISEVAGYFREFSGTVESKKDNDFSNAQIDFTVKTSSINTDNEKRDAHLKSDDFFNSEKYPAMTFKGKSMKKIGKDKYTLVGDLTIRDVTKEIKLDVVYNGTVKDPWGLTRAGFKLTGQLNRFDYNLKWNTLMETGGAMVDKTIKIESNLEFVVSK